MFANDTLKMQLSLLHIAVEPTGACTSSQNGKAEVSIKLIGSTAQCLMYGAQMDPTFWCFAVTYATFLVNVRPFDAHNGRTPHEVFHKHAPNLSMAFIFGSPLHVKNLRASRHQPDSNNLLGTFVCFQGRAHIYQHIGDSGRVQYAHHAVVDELCVHQLHHDRSPAAIALLDHPAGDQSVGAHTLALQHAIEGRTLFPAALHGFRLTWLSKRSLTSCLMRLMAFNWNIFLT